ncbi:hypothetical protein Q3G72_001522 [Acer saccharum]|nr:hypothetical protein Q3G72_001522 [Acer saccharum]
METLEGRTPNMRQGTVSNIILQLHSGKLGFYYEKEWSYCKKMQSAVPNMTVKEVNQAKRQETRTTISERKQGAS